MQRLLADLVGQIEGNRRFLAAHVRIERLRGSGVTLELSQGRIGGSRIAVDVDRRSRVAVDRERRLRGRRREQRAQVRVDLADLVRRARRRRIEVAVRVAPIAVVRDAAGEVVVLVGGDDEQRVLLVDPVLLQPVEEGRERVVVRLQRCDVIRFAGTRGARKDSVRVGRSRESVRVVVMRVRDVPERDRNAGLLHLRDVAERHLRRHPVEAGEARVAEGVRDRVAGSVLDDGTTAGDRRVDVESAEESLAGIAAGRLVGEHVRLCVRALVADPAAGPAVDRDADEVG